MSNLMPNDRWIHGIPRRFLFALGLLSLTVPIPASEPGKLDGHITRFDIATRDDLLFARLIGPVMVGDTSEWSKRLLGGMPGQVGDWVSQFTDARTLTSEWSKRLLGGMPGQVGDWVSQFTDARTLASIVTKAFPVEGQ